MIMGHRLDTCSSSGCTTLLLILSQQLNNDLKAFLLVNVQVMDGIMMYCGSDIYHLSEGQRFHGDILFLLSFGERNVEPRQCILCIFFTHAVYFFVVGAFQFFRLA